MIEIDTTNGLLRIGYMGWSYRSPSFDDFTYIDNPLFPKDNPEVQYWEEQLYAQMMGWA